MKSFVMGCNPPGATARLSIDVFSGACSIPVNVVFPPEH